MNQTQFCLIRESIFSQIELAERMLPPEDFKNFITKIINNLQKISIVQCGSCAIFETRKQPYNQVIIADILENFKHN